jgi:hypothetical protein
MHFEYQGSFNPRCSFASLFFITLNISLLYVLGSLLPLQCAFFKPVKQINHLSNDTGLCVFVSPSVISSASSGHCMRSKRVDDRPVGASGSGGNSAQPATGDGVAADMARVVL